MGIRAESCLNGFQFFTQKIGNLQKTLQRLKKTQWYLKMGRTCVFSKFLLFLAHLELSEPFEIYFEFLTPGTTFINQFHITKRNNKIYNRTLLNKLFYQLNFSKFYNQIPFQINEKTKSILSYFRNENLKFERY